MKFLNIYKQTEHNLRLALLSFWAPGKNPMRKALNEMFDREPLIAEPVFQSTFGWESVSDNNWKSSLNQHVISKLEIGEKYDPYLHQVKSWEALQRGKSIVVTSGTGSGKTECFMYPVISDLYEHKGENAIQAIFLYPLNALMEDQKKRLNHYCKSTGLKFAVYNGSTPNYTANNDKMSEEVGTREEIRDKDNLGTRPQILLTNPSMLEYILVRQGDQVMLEKSEGKLRWIVIDEAHTYSGSAAMELALQIKRILEAFNVKANDVRFACTSATIGGGGSQSLIEFISTVIGQKIENIVEIGGNRIVPSISETDLDSVLNKCGLIDISADHVLNLREYINTSPGISLRAIWEALCPEKDYVIEDALNLVDNLCDLKVNDLPVLSLRGHFFMRSISGVYACGNIDCKGSKGSSYGRLTSYKSSKCNECDSPLLELVQCPRCSSFMLMGSSDPITKEVRPVDDSYKHPDYFAISDYESDDAVVSLLDDEEECGGCGDNFFALPYDKKTYFNPLTSAHSEIFNLQKRDGVEYLIHADRNDGKWVDLRKDSTHSYCPKCGRLAEGKRMYFKYLRVPISFINQTVSPIFLKESAPQAQDWGKYIVFADSRQGTAISAKTFNIEVERRICRSRTVAELAKRASTGIPEELRQYWDSLPPEVKSSILAEQKGKSQISIYELAKAIFDEKLFAHIADIDTSDEREAYRAALIRHFIGQHQTYTQGVENMGLLMLVYPALKDLKAPEELLELAEKNNIEISGSDWQDFLKIALDYILRHNVIQPLISGERKFVRDTSISRPISKEEWPKVKVDKVGNVYSRNQSRLVLLLCAAMGINNTDKLKMNLPLIDRVLEKAWNTLVDKRILTEVLPSSTSGYNDPKFFPDQQYIGHYYLDLSPREDNNVAKITRPESAWICPVTGRLVDTIFRGYSPLMIGELGQGLFNMYRCGDKIKLPLRPADENEALIWINNQENLKSLIDNGLWTDRHIYAYNSISPYIAAEHSAQQDKKLLKRYVEEFTQPVPKINVLHCSTTMEMGVDIGDIDVVLMDTIPPSSANYMQRVGRAGRMGQTKSIAFSMCNNTPVGQYAFAHPMWAITAITEMKPVRKSNVILQRHINSYFFRQFVCTQGDGLAVTTSIGDFMAGDFSQCDAFAKYLDDISTNHVAEKKFHAVFGDVPFDRINLSRSAIIQIKEKYHKILKELKDAFESAEGNERAKLAISIQQDKYVNKGMLNYLSEEQFLPNASMPTGVVTFEFRDKDTTHLLGKKIRERRKLREKIKDASEIEKPRLKQEASNLTKEINRIQSATEASRDAHTALNEYAPEQTVVVDEKNYVSAGVRLFGTYNEDTQSRFIYFCKHCGNVEYKETMLASNICSKCGAPYHSILKDNRENSFTAAYEPIGFRTDQNNDSTREESTEKSFYEIKPILLKCDWDKAQSVNMCDVIDSGDNGQILFYNAGAGNGFALCKHCGRAAIESNFFTKELPNRVKIGHKRLDWEKIDECCDATERDIARNVVFTAKHFTCYSVLRFKKSPDRSEYEKDESLVYSLGVMIRRALASYLGVDESEIDFGWKEERTAMVLFVYDTARGGCGYSRHLANPDELNEVLSLAKKMLCDYSCHCEDTGGACSQCLVDRSNFRYANLLSKGKVIDWILRQSMRVSKIPSQVRELLPDVRISYNTPKGLLRDALEQNSDVKAISLYVSDNCGEVVMNDWMSGRSEMGRLIRRIVDKGIIVKLYLEYHPALHVSVADKYPFVKLSIPDVDIQFVKDLGSCKPVVSIEQTDGKNDNYFSTDQSVISFSNQWSENINALYVSQRRIEVNPEVIPSLEDNSLVVREGRISDLKEIQIANYFSKAIVPTTLEPQDIDKIQDILFRQNVTIHFSDMYLNSAMSSLMLAYLIKEMQDLLGFTIERFVLQIDSPRRKCANDRFCEHSYISHNWPSATEADEYTENVLEDILGIIPEKSNEDAEHHRFLKITNQIGSSVEIRFDHGIAGGWKTYAEHLNLSRLNGSTKITTCDQDILYYVILKSE